MSRPLFRRSAAVLAAFLILGPITSAAEDHAPGVRVTVLEDTALTTTVRYELEAFDQRQVTIDGAPFVALELHGEGVHHEVGAPDLPRVARSVLLPDRGAAEVQVLGASFREVDGVDLVPARGPITRDVDPATVPYVFGELYTQDRWFPETPAALRSPYVMRDARGVVVEANLFQYNPARRSLRIYDELTVEVMTTGRPGAAEIDRSAVPARPDVNFEQIYRRHFLNGQQRLSGVDRAGPEGQCGDMLIISFGQAMPMMQPLVDWKNSIGIHTTMVDVTTIGNDKNLIKAFIQQTYDASNLAYVLLVGDAAQVTSFSYQGGYSDPTYSLMDGDWYPDLLVGRFSISTPAHVTTMVDRTIAYEQAGHELAMGGWNAKSMGIASNEGPGHYGEYDNAHMGLIRDQYLAGGFTQVDALYQPSATKAMVKAGLEEGRRFVNYVGHGSSSSWSTTGFSTSDVHNLDNAGVLPVVHAVACVNGQFSKAECFAEAWLRATDDTGAPTGAAAAYMSTINQYWNEPMYGQACHGKGGKYGYVDLFLQEADWSVGGLWFGGSATIGLETEVMVGVPDVASATVRSKAEFSVSFEETNSIEKDYGYSVERPVRAPGGQKKAVITTMKKADVSMPFTYDLVHYKQGNKSRIVSRQPYSGVYSGVRVASVTTDQIAIDCATGKPLISVAEQTAPAPSVQTGGAATAPVSTASIETPAAVTPFTVSQVVTSSGGIFEKGDEGYWHELSEMGDVRFTFEVIDRNEDCIYLLDVARGVLIVLNLARDKVEYAASVDEEPFDLYDITSKS